MNEITKTCFKCLESLPLNSFYVHKAMADGRLNKCKNCTKKQVVIYQKLNREKVLAYDKKRNMIPQRLDAIKAFSKTEAGKKIQRKAQQTYRHEHPDRKHAHSLVFQALKNGLLNRLPCIVCGETAEAHHPDYSRPLDVIWLCSMHYREVHRMHRQNFLNGSTATLNG